MPCWREGNAVMLLENGDAFFPAVLSAINAARHEIILETFIWFDDAVGRALHQALRDAALRGVRVEVLLDGYGSSGLNYRFISMLTGAGVIFRYYDPRRPLFGIRINVFRRMHRKIVVIDGALAFIGGINYSDDHLSSTGPAAKQDYAVRIIGPVVADIYRYVTTTDLDDPKPLRRQQPHRSDGKEALPGKARALFVWRDNGQHRTDIERHYLNMLRKARCEVIIANAYFFPGYRLLAAMRRAARRGVTVKLIVQGKPDMPLAQAGSRLLYRYLCDAGVRVYEYRRRPFHGKVALMDDRWATIGSSNLDPFSLALNLEANLVIDDFTFNRTLRDHLSALLRRDCQRVDATVLSQRRIWNIAMGVAAFHFLRYFPALLARLPARLPKVTELSLSASPQDLDGTPTGK